MKIDDLYTEILKQGLDQGGEPEYIQVKTPIKDDPKGWFIAWNWMHHDGEITQMICRGQNFEEAGQKMLEALQGSRHPTTDEISDLEEYNKSFS